MQRRHVIAALLPACCLAPSALRAAAAVEWHHRLRAGAGDPAAPVALTLDACSGAYDADLIHLLMALRVPATLFVTKRWLDRNADAARELLARPELFELEDHGTAHVPAIVAGPDSPRTLYGMAVQPDVEHLRAEVLGAADRIRVLSGRAPRFFRGAGAAYDETGRRTIEALGLQIAGFSVNADAGATLPAATVAARLRGVKPGDIVIAHMNHPGRGTAAGFAAALPGLLARGLHFVKLSQAELVRVP
jgi:peptidoglycan/xylan/chitin deacetylase (PgdA/CDA1 family)